MVLQVLRRLVVCALLGGALLLVASLACTSGGEDEPPPATPTAAATATPTATTETPSPTATLTATATATATRVTTRILTPGQMLTIEEYGEWCAGNFGVGEVPQISTWGAYASLLDRAILGGRSVAPPDVLRDYHAAAIEGLVQVWLAARKFEPEAVFTPDDLHTSALLTAWLLGRALDALPGDVRDTLEEAGCIYVDAAAIATPTPGPTATPARTPTAEASAEAVPVVADGPPSWRTLQYVIARDELWCGVKQTQPLFGFKKADGTVTGFDIEFCKAIAAAVLGDATKVKYVDASDASTRFEILEDAEVDVLIRTTTVTAVRDRDRGVDFAQPIFYTGQGFAVRKDSGYDSTSDMAEAVICVQTGTTTERNVAAHFTEIGLTYHPTGRFSSDVADAFFSGRCDVLTADASDLASRISLRDDATDYKILPQIISKEPLAPAVRDYDSEWKDVVNWVVHGLIAAEELEITQANVAAMAADPPNTEIARLLGVPFEGRAVSTLGFDAVGAQFIQRAIAAVGNYGEIYARTIGDWIPRACSLNALASDDSVDCPPGQGGILYALPYR